MLSSAVAISKEAVTMIQLLAEVSPLLSMLRCDASIPCCLCRPKLGPDRAVLAVPSCSQTLALQSISAANVSVPDASVRTLGAPDLTDAHIAEAEADLSTAVSHCKNARIAPLWWVVIILWSWRHVEEGAQGAGAGCWTCEVLTGRMYRLCYRTPLKTRCLRSQR